MPKTISAELARLRPTIQPWINSAAAAAVTNNITQQFITQQVDLSGYLTIAAGDMRYYQKAEVDVSLDAIRDDITDLQADQHDQVHDITGPDHTAPGALPGQVVQAGSGVIDFVAGGTIQFVAGGDMDAITPLLSWEYLDHNYLSNVGTDDHHAQVHNLTSSDHTVSGLTTGHYLRANSATTFGFAQPSHTELSDINPNDHHEPVTIADSTHFTLDGNGQRLNKGADIAVIDEDNFFTAEQHITGKLYTTDDIEVGDDALIADSLRVGDPAFGAPGYNLDVQGDSYFVDRMTVGDGEGWLNSTGIRSADFEDRKYDLTGFQIKWDGQAKIRSLFAPTLSTIFFEKREVHAIGNTMIVATGASLYTDLVVPSVALSSTTIQVRDPQSGPAILFSRGEHLIIKTNATGVVSATANAGHPPFGPLLYMTPTATVDGIGTPLETWWTVLNYSQGDGYTAYDVRLEYYVHPVSTRLIGYYDFRDAETETEAIKNRVRFGENLTVIKTSTIEFVAGGAIELMSGDDVLNGSGDSGDLTFSTGVVIDRDVAFDTGIIPHDGMTVIAKVRDFDPSALGQRVFGVKSSAVTDDYSIRASGTAGQAVFTNGEDTTISIGGGTDFDGVVAIIGSGNYGVNDTASSYTFDGVDPGGLSLYLGARNKDGEATEQFDGVLEWVVIYNSALTTTEYQSVVRAMEYEVGDTLTTTTGPFTYEENKAVVSFGDDDDGRVILDSNDDSAMVIVRSTSTPWVETELQLTLGEMDDDIYGGTMYGLKLEDDPSNTVDGEVILTNTQRKFSNVYSEWKTNNESTTLSASDGLVMNREILTDTPYIWQVTTRTDRADDNSETNHVASFGLLEFLGPGYYSQLASVLRAHWHDKIALRDDDGNFLENYDDYIEEGSHLRIQADGKTVPSFDSDGNTIDQLVGTTSEIRLRGGRSENIAGSIDIWSDHVGVSGNRGVGINSPNGNVVVSSNDILFLSATSYTDLLSADIRMRKLPTSAPSESGRLWNNSGTLSITS